MKITNQIVIEIAKEIGFDLVGFTKAEELREETERLKKWLDYGYNASMQYMEQNFEKRLDVKKILPSAKSVVSLAMNYFTNEKYELKDGCGKVSSYAWGKDYHLVMWDKLDLIEKKLRTIDPQFECLTYVDTGPVMDKSWAVRAGIGWLGKHTNVISRELGSWIFLATLISNYEFDYNKPATDFCGSCTACIAACPTDAIVDEYVVDSNKCISFLTIENKDEIPLGFKGKFDNWLFGCDICQDVCPWNHKFSQPGREQEFRSNGNKEINLDEINLMNDDDFKTRFEKSPIKRAKLKGLFRKPIEVSPKLLLRNF